MASSKVRNVRFAVTQLNVEPNQYKPYLSTLTADNVFVDIPVPEEEVIAYGKQIVLTVDGLSAILCEIGTSIANMADEVRKSKLGY